VNLLLALALAVPSAFAIENVRVEVGDGTVLDKATVVVDGGKITAVGEGVKVPAGAERVDGAGRTLAPGFVETRGQLGLIEVLMEGSTNDHRATGLFTPALRVAEGFYTASVRIPIEREEGVTSSIISPTGGVIAGPAYWVDHTGAPDSAPDPATPLAMFGRVDRRAADMAGGTRAALWLKLREVFDDVRFYKKNRAAYDRAQSRKLALSRVHLEAMIPVVDGKLPLVLQAYRASDIVAAIRFAKEQKVGLVLMGAMEGWLVADQIKAAGVPVIVQPSLQEPWGFESLRVRDDLAAALERAGVRVIITANENWDQNARRIRQEAGIAVAHGLSRGAAWRAVTLEPARAFGRDKQLGTIAKGKRADLVLWSGDPFELSSVAERIWIAGAPMSLDTRQRQLSRRYLERAR
jgi:imidazolonepropionase-like amidohydrolase